MRRRRCDEALHKCALHQLLVHLREGVGGHLGEGARDRGGRGALRGPRVASVRGIMGCHGSERVSYAASVAAFLHQNGEERGRVELAAALHPSGVARAERGEQIEHGVHARIANEWTEDNAS